MSPSSRDNSPGPAAPDPFVRVRGARVHNLRNIDVVIPRDALVVFTGISGSGKSSLAFGTLFAEAQRRYLESVAPYARRLFDQMGVPDVDEITGLPPAVALQQQRGAGTTRSSVGSVTTLSNLLRMLYSRAGLYPRGAPMIYADAFSTNTPDGACPTCHGLGRRYDVTEQSLVPDNTLSIRERAISAWPSAWHGQNLRDICVTLGFDIDAPWKTLSKKDRNWLLFTDEQPTVPVFAGFEADEVKRAIRRKEEPSYMGTFTSAKRYVLHTFANSSSPHLRRRAAAHLMSSECPTCDGKGLNPQALRVTFAGLDIADMSRLPMSKLASALQPFVDGRAPAIRAMETDHPEKAIVAQRIAADVYARLQTVLELGLGYLSLDRTTPTLSPGELQRLRLATQIRSNLFGVVYVLDEPSAGLHPADTAALLDALERLRASGNSLFVVEHDLDVIRRADWLVDVGPAAGEQGGTIVYSGPIEGLRTVEDSETRRHLFGDDAMRRPMRSLRSANAWLELEGVTRHNLRDVHLRLPLGVLTTVTGVSGSGKSSLVSQALVDLVNDALGHDTQDDEGVDAHHDVARSTTDGRIVSGVAGISRLVVVDQKPIGRTPRSNLATYTGLFDHVRRLFAATRMARARKYDAGRFSFNVAKGRCEQCAGEGFVMVELLFLPSVYAPCPVCHGARFNAKTLEVRYEGKHIAEVLQLTVNDAHDFFATEPPVARALSVLRDVGLGYLRLGQPATELSGGEAQRIKLATELQRGTRGHTLYVLDEPTTGLHPTDVERLVAQLDRLVDAGNTVVVVEHNMRLVAHSDHVIDVGPGAGEEGGRIVVTGTPAEVAGSVDSITGQYLAAQLRS